MVTATHIDDILREIEHSIRVHWDCMHYYRRLNCLMLARQERRRLMDHIELRRVALGKPRYGRTIR